MNVAAICTRENPKAGHLGVANQATTASANDSFLRRRFVSALGSLLLLASMTVGQGNAAEAVAQWQPLYNKEGILVSRLEGPQTTTSTAFRGKMEIDANLFIILSVLQDSSRRMEWTDRGEEAYQIEAVSPIESIEYARIDSFWPLSDRDLVLHAKTSIDRLSKTVLVRFVNVEHPQVPPKKGVERLPEIKGHYLLTELNENRTRVEYQVQAQLGGGIPEWIAGYVVKQMPFKTLQGLHNQVLRTHGQYPVSNWAELETLAAHR